MKRELAFPKLIIQGNNVDYEPFELTFDPTIVEFTVSDKSTVLSILDKSGNEKIILKIDGIERACRMLGFITCDKTKLTTFKFEIIDKNKI